MIPDSEHESRPDPRAAHARLACVGLACGLAILYIVTLLPGLGAGDSAKFQFIGHVLGVPHSTGYPLYVLLNGVFVKLVPFGTVAWRANLLSALFGVGTVLVVVALQRRWGVRIGPALLAGATLALTRQFWRAAVVAEVYTLATFLMVTVLWLLVLWEQERRSRYLLLAIYVWGLSLGNHMWAAFLLPGVVAFVILARRSTRMAHAGGTSSGRPGDSRLPWRFWLAAVAVVAVALSIYLLLWMRAVAPGHHFVEMRGTGIGDLFRHVSGASFRSHMFAFSPREILTERFPLYLEFLFNEFWILLPLAIWGWLRMPAAARAFCAVTVVLNALYFVNYDIPDIASYVLPSTLFLACGLGPGYQALVDRLGRSRRRLALAVALLIPAALCGSNLNQGGQHRERGFDPRVQRQLEAVDRDALILEPEYVGSCQLRYYLYVESWQDRNVHVRYARDPEPLLAYLAQGAPLRDSYERRTIQPGCAVYTVSRRGDEYCADLGLVLEPVDGHPDIHRVDLAAGPQED